MNRLLLTIFLLAATASAATLDDQIRLAYPAATNGVNYTIDCQWLGTPQDGCTIASWDTNALGPKPALTNLPTLAQAAAAVTSNQHAVAENLNLSDVHIIAAALALRTAINARLPATNQITIAELTNDFKNAMRTLEP